MGCDDKGMAGCWNGSGRPDLASGSLWREESGEAQQEREGRRTTITDLAPREL